MTIAERILETIKDRPETRAAQVLGFADHLTPQHQAPVVPLAPDASPARYAGLHPVVESRPPQVETVGDFVRRMHDEVRH